MSVRPHASLKFLFPGWFAVVMGLCGLALAWQAAVPLMGAPAAAAALALGIAGGAAFAALAVATLLRARHHPEAWAEDRRHPVRHAFVATLPASLLLLATLAVALGLRGGWVLALWWTGALSQIGVTLWVMRRWWHGKTAALPHGGLSWAGLTPALFIPVVGNVLVPLAGVPLGQAEWSAAQFGVGLLFWPLVTLLLLVRLAVQGPWPDRLRPTSFIFVAPPAVVGLAALQFQAPLSLVWMLWGMAAFSLLWAGSQLRQIAALPFGLAHWGMSFPLAALTALSAALAPQGRWLATLTPVLLAASSLLVAALLLATWRGLRDGTLLAPEPVAAITPVAAAAAG